MPFYEFNCPEHGVFSEMIAMADMPQVHACETCGVESPKILSLFGNISSSDDPSFGSSANGKLGQNLEHGGFDADAKHDWAERPTHSKSDWEYA